MPDRPKRMLLVGRNWGGHNRTEHLLAWLSESSSLGGIEVRVAGGDALPWRHLSWHRLAVLPANVLFLLGDLLQALWADIVFILPLNYAALGYARLLAQVGRCRLVVDYYAAAVTTLEERGGERCWIGRAAECRRFDRLAIERSDLLIVPQRGEIDAAAAMLGARVREERLRVVPLCSPDRGSTFSWRAGMQLRLVWWGVFTPLHGASIVLEALTAFRERDQQLHLTVVGVEENRSSIAADIERLGLSKIVSFRSDLRFHDGTLPGYLAGNCDLALGHFGRSKKAAHVVSNKIVEALSLGLPVMTGDGPGVREMMSGSEVLLVDRAPGAVTEALRRVAAGEVDLAALASSGKEAFERTFTVSRYRARMHSILLGDGSGRGAHGP